MYDKILIEVSYKVEKKRRRKTN